MELHSVMFTALDQDLPSNTMQMTYKNKPNQLFLSVEWSPPTDVADLDMCVEKAVETCKRSSSKFCGVSWHCTSFDLDSSLILKFACKVQENCIDVIVHLTPQNLTEEDIFRILHHLKKNRIRHVFALRGDVKSCKDKACFSFAKELVSFIRKHFGNYFTIFVAGYPSGHSKKLSRNVELQYLKEKVDAGANYIITQAVFDAKEFINFVRQCRNIGIVVPIIPGIMPIQNAVLLLRLHSKCKFPFTNEIYSALIEMKDNEEKLTKFGIQKAKEIITEIIESGIGVHGIHFFTLNRPNPALQVWKQLSLEMSNQR